MVFYVLNSQENVQITGTQLTELTLHKPIIFLTRTRKCPYKKPKVKVPRTESLSKVKNSKLNQTNYNYQNPRQLFFLSFMSESEFPL
jgi:hypothetical protein